MPAKYTDSTVDYLNAYVQPTCGPNPRSYSGNWTGDLTTGVLYSYADYDNTRVYVEAGVGKANPIAREDDDAPSIARGEIVRRVYGLDR